MIEFLDPLVEIAAKSRRGYAMEPGRILRADGEVEAVRFYLTDGASFSGWIVRSTRNPGHDYSDPIPRRTDAIAALLAWVGA